MGGVLILIAIGVSTLLWCDLSNRFIWPVLIITLGYGAVGWVDADRSIGELNVAIRTFWVEDQRLCFGTGGAITWDSTPPDEWAETELKAERLIAIASGCGPR